MNINGCNEMCASLLHTQISQIRSSDCEHFGDMISTSLPATVSHSTLTGLSAADWDMPYLPSINYPSHYSLVTQNRCGMWTGKCQRRSSQYSTLTYQQLTTQHPANTD